MNNNRTKNLTISALVLGSVFAVSNNVVSANEYYTVQPGEGFNAIAIKNNISVQELLELNNKSITDVIHPGDQLIVKKEETITENEPETNTQVTETEQTVTQEETTSTVENVYTVQRGDYLHKIAKDHGVTVDDIKKWNNLSSNYIYVGDKLYVSEPTTQTTTTTQSSSSNEQQTTSSSAPTSRKVYTVRRGDYLHKIAKENGVTVDDIKKWNNLSSNYIYVGDKLYVSEPTTQTTTTQSSSSNAQQQTSAPTTRKVYTVRRGDYLHKIAKENGVTVDDIKKWNNLSSNYIYVGDKLYVSQPTTQTTTTQSSSSNTQQTTSSSAPTSRKVYTVRRGDYLHKIAKENGVTVDDIKKWNNLSSNYIYVGDKLYVSEPTQTTTEKKEETTQTSSTPTTRKVHTVKRGDYLHKIAKENGVTVDDIKKWNNLSSNYIYVGDKLYVSEPTQTTTTQSSSSNTQQTTSSAPTTRKVYTVKRGDYLHKIAKENGVTVDDIKKWNNLSSNYIYVGDKLYVSEPTQTTTTQSSSSNAQQQTTTPTTRKVYTVKRGDHLHKIAKDYGVTVDDIKKWNNLSSNYIYVGDKLYVSEPTQTTTTQSSSSNTQQTTSSAPTTRKVYTVRRGDYLHKIAKENGVTVDDIKKWNNLSSNYIYVGDKLYVSEPTQTTTTQSSSSNTQQQTTTPTTRKVHTVKRGDYLHKIAKENGVTVDDIKKWNNLSSNYIYTGDKLYVSAPTGGSSQSVAQHSDRTSDQRAVKLNAKQGKWIMGSNINTGRSTNVQPYFGQKFAVTGSVKRGNTTYLELSQNGRVVGYAPESYTVDVPYNSNVVYIDAGHGGRETGAVQRGVTEKELNLNISRQVADRLRRQGYTVYETRTTDTYVDLRDRQKEPNKLMPDIYVSIHHNAMPASRAGSAQGILTLYHDESISEPGYRTMPHHVGTDIIPEGKRLAASIHRALLAETGAPNNGLRPQNLHVTRTTDMPATLVELGFMDHPTEFRKITNKQYQEKLVSGVVKGINNYFK